MKNIHLLPTDKPSRIIKSQDNDFVVLNTDAPNWFGDYLKTTKQHIYITSDDKFVKDEYITDGIEVIKASPKLVNAQGLINRRDWKKIILSTDEDLIKDGVQAIDDEFLEWFVKNPSCEEVEIIQMCRTCDAEGKEGDSYCQRSKECNRGWAGEKYKIIIPKEEPKQETLEEAYETELYLAISNIIDGGKDLPKGSIISRGKAIDYAFETALKISKWQQQQMYREKEVPNKLDSVLAKITHQNDLGLSQWYEVVYYADGKWCSYSGSKTFEDGERVVEWKYCKDLI